MGWAGAGGDKKKGVGGYDHRVRWGAEWKGAWQGWGRGQAAWQGESDCAERAECSGPAVRSAFISGLCVRYNLPGCQESTSIPQHPPTTTITTPSPALHPLIL